MSRALRAWDVGLAAFASIFTQPSFVLFRELVWAWVLCPGRRTVTGMIRTIAPHRRRPHDAYHRLLRAGAWSLSWLWRLLGLRLVEGLAPPGAPPPGPPPPPSP